MISKKSDNYKTQHQAQTNNDKQYKSQKSKKTKQHLHPPQQGNHNARQDLLNKYNEE